MEKKIFKYLPAVVVVSALPVSASAPNYYWQGDCLYNETDGKYITDSTKIDAGKTFSMKNGIWLKSSENRICSSFSEPTVMLDVNPVIDGTVHGGGMSGFTFDVYINDVLVADNVTDFYQNVPYNAAYRIVPNKVANYDSEGTEGYVGSGASVSYPVWKLSTIYGYRSATGYGGWAASTSSSYYKTTWAQNWACGSHVEKSCGWHWPCGNDSCKTWRCNNTTVANSCTLYADVTSWGSVTTVGTRNEALAKKSTTVMPVYSNDGGATWYELS